MSDAPTIYVVWDGIYEDATPAGYFTTKAKAEAYVAWMNGPAPTGKESIGIEEVLLDRPIPTTGHFVCWVDIIRGPEGLTRATTERQVKWFRAGDPSATGSVTWAGSGCVVTGQGPTPEAAVASAEGLIARVLDRTVTEPVHGTPFRPGITPDDSDPTA